MPAIVGQIDRIVRPHMDAVRALILAFAPGPQEVSVAVEHRDRVLAATESIDIVLGVDADRGDLLERPAVRQLRPVLDDAVLEVAGANDFCHCVLLNAPARISAMSGCKPAAAYRERIAATASMTPRRHRGRRASR